MFETRWVYIHNLVSRSTVFPELIWSWCRNVLIYLDQQAQQDVGWFCRHFFETGRLPLLGGSSPLLRNV